MNNKKEKKTKISSYLLILFLCIFFFVGIIIFNGIEGNIGSLVIFGIGIVGTMWGLYHEIYGTKKKVDNPAVADLYNKSGSEPQTPQEIYSIMAKNNSFLHPTYGRVELQLEGLWEHSGADFLFVYDKLEYDLRIDLDSKINIEEFIQNAEIKIKIIDEFDRIMKENREKLRSYFIEKQYENAWDWLTGSSYDKEDSVYYTGNKTKEEFKKALYNNMEFHSYTVSIDSNYEIEGIVLNSSIGALFTEIDVDIKNGEVDYNTIDMSIDL